MICAWKELLSVLPGWIRGQLHIFEDEMLQEIRLRINQPPCLVFSAMERTLEGTVSADDLNFCVNTASAYSPWTASTLAHGFLTANGGHRIGVCGQAVCQNGVVTGFRRITSLCIRVARDIPGIAEKALRASGSTLIIGPPGRGKTTFLRDLVRQTSDSGTPVTVVDERGELFPQGCFLAGSHTDVLTGCSKDQGIEMALRCMGPAVIAVDEITAEADCDALIQAGWCGVRLFATAHAADKDDLRRRPVYRPLVKSGVFDTLIVLQLDKSWRAERMVP